jgi:hypothetical protein
LALEDHVNLGVVDPHGAMDVLLVPAGHGFQKTT